MTVYIAMCVYVYVCELLMLLIFIKAGKWNGLFLFPSSLTKPFCTKIQTVRRSVEQKGPWVGRMSLEV